MCIYKELRPTRNAFSLVEIVVVAVVLSILAALTVTGIQAVRESSRRMQCMNNQRQLMQGMQGFHAAWNHFPGAPGPGPHDKFSEQINCERSLHVELLPFVDQNNLQLKLKNTSVTNGFDITREVKQLLPTGLVIFECPSDYVGLGTNYRGCTGPGIGHVAPSETLSDIMWAVGPFATNGVYSVSDFQRGTSQTVMLSEKRKGWIDAPYTLGAHIWGSGLIFLIGLDVGAYSADDLRAIAAAEAGVAVAPLVDNSGQYWWLWNYRDTLYNHTMTPNENLLSMLMAGPHNRGLHIDGGLVGATSRHPGGVVAGLGDGSCRLFSNTVDLAFWQEMSRREAR